MVEAISDIDSRLAQLQQSRARVRRADSPALPHLPSKQPREDTQERTLKFGVSQEGLDETQQLQQNRVVAAVERAIAKQLARSQTQALNKEQTQAQALKQQAEVKARAKTSMRRGAIYVVDLLASALDLSSAGISFLIDIFFYAFSLGWLNLEMIYGKYFAKGKSRYISPISWDPIPMPVDKGAIILQGFIITADLALALAILILAVGGFCIVHDITKITSSIAGAIQIGAALAQGQGAGLCLGGILASGFGLGL